MSVRATVSKRPLPTIRQRGRRLINESTASGMTAASNMAAAVPQRAAGTLR